MKIGAMNDPRQEVVAEVAACARAGLDFLDLTLEPPRARSDQLQVREVARALDAEGLEVVGHTCYFLPIASPYPGLRSAALEEVRRSLEAFAELGARLVNIHPQERAFGLSARKWQVEQHTGVLTELARQAQQLGLTLMLENGATILHRAQELETVLQAVPGLALELDLAHANLNTEQNRAPELIHRLGPHVRHVHISDNRGGSEDLHLPLGVGSIQWGPVIRALKGSGYDAGITLEIHARYREYLLVSRDRLRTWWEQADFGEEEVERTAE